MMLTRHLNLVPKLREWSYIPPPSVPLWHVWDNFTCTLVSENNKITIMFSYVKNLTTLGTFYWIKSSLVRLLDPEDVGTTVFQNLSNNPPVTMVFFIF
jgi:hypothetical protein